MSLILFNNFNLSPHHGKQSTVKIRLITYYIIKIIITRFAFCIKPCHWSDIEGPAKQWPVILFEMPILFIFSPNSPIKPRGLVRWIYRSLHLKSDFLYYPPWIIMMIKNNRETTTTPIRFRVGNNIHTVRQKSSRTTPLSYFNNTQSEI